MGSARWLLPLLLAELWLIVVYRMGALWVAHPDYNYGWIVPCLCLAAAWERIGGCPEPTPPRRGLAVAWVAGLSLLLVPTRLALEVLPTWRFASWALGLEAVGITLGLVYALGGRAWLRHFMFPVAFFLVAVPWPTAFEEPFIQKLSRLNAAWAVQALAVFDVAAFNRGNLIEIASGTLGVDEACSGIRSFQGTFMAALFLGELARFGVARRGLLLILGAMLSFSFNVVRTTLLTWSCEQRGLSALGAWHDPAGLSILGVTLVCLLGLTWWLHRGVRPRSDREKAPVAKAVPMGVAAPPVWLLIGMGLLVGGVELGLAGWFAAKEKTLSKAPGWTVRWPTGQEGFRTVPIAESAREILGCDEGGGAEWSESGTRWQAFEFRWHPSRTLYRRVKASAHAKGHQPDLCLSSSGMALKKDLGEKLVRSRTQRFVFHGYEFEDRGRRLFVFSSVWEQGKERGPKESVRIEASTGHAFGQVWDDLRHGDRDGALEQRVLKFGMWGAADGPTAEAALARRLEQMIVPAP